MKRITFCTIVMAGFLITGCSTASIKPYIERANVSLHKTGAALRQAYDNLDIKITPYEDPRPEDDTN